MFFWKKLLSPLLFPQTLCLGLLVVGVLMLWFKSKSRLARALVTLAAVALVVLSYPSIWSGIVHRVEDSYPSLDLHRPDLGGIDWVVVLGGGGEMTSDLPAPGRLSAASLSRLVEGMRIQQRIPEAKLLVSGYSDAILMQQAAHSLGIRPQQIINENNARDTEEQAVEVKRFVRGDRFILVTSAYHMPRAMGLFAKQGLMPIPAPTDFYIKDPEAAFSAVKLYPTASGPVEAGLLVKEFFGILWAKLRGRI